MREKVKGEKNMKKRGRSMRYREKAVRRKDMVNGREVRGDNRTEKTERERQTPET